MQQGGGGSKRVVGNSTQKGTKREPSSNNNEVIQNSENSRYNIEGEIAPTSEIRNLVDPFTGAYVSKLTLPKNYSGKLYLGGLNITSLANKLVSVRFKFGRELEPITIPATIGRAPGIIPQSDVEVLMLDLGDKPFDNMRLLYDLFDYSDYTSTATPVADSRDRNLYCRGLSLDYDPTFAKTSENSLCDTTGEKCLYAFAKIKDNGYVNSSTDISLIPSDPLIDLGSIGLASDSSENILKKCLPDNGTPYYSAPTGYKYVGPYRALSKDLWEIGTSAAITLSAEGTPPTGVFMKSLSGTSIDYGANSYMFPRSGKITLSKDVEYAGSTTAIPFTSSGVSRTVQTQVSTGNTATYMDGCNLRVTNYDTYENEGISSCNVTALIEVITVDASTGTETILTSTKTLKLQLTRASLKNTNDQEVLYSAMKSCNSSKTCDKSECCYNNRCWSKDLVSKCADTALAFGNLGTGKSCATDYECASLCCNQSTKTCAVQDLTSTPAVLCSKPAGAQCVATEWCREYSVKTCLKVKTGLDALGKVTCAIRCYNKQTYATCKNGICVPPDAQAAIPFDPSAPDCKDAVAAPDLL
ncbi:MAG: hypothetical protein U0T83_01675 [Bacteriovoracaceae bacterium]